MKYISTIISSILAGFILCPGNNCHDGHYYANEGFKEIIIRNDSLFYILHQGNMKLYANDTIAICNVTHLEKDWAEINSVPVIFKAIESMTIESRYDESIKDSIKIALCIPSRYYDFDCWITLSLRPLYEISFSVNDGHGEITIERGNFNNLLLLSLYPKTYMYNLIDKMIRGLAWERFPINMLFNNEHNSYKIILPEVSDSYFERYYVRGEYIRFQNDTLIWRGEKFIKNRG